MTSYRYQQEAMRTNDHRSSQRLTEFCFKPNQRYDIAQLFNATLGQSHCNINSLRTGNKGVIIDDNSNT